jgi:hypothetical protein
MSQSRSKCTDCFLVVSWLSGCLLSSQDDHDLGINDGGSEVDSIPDRQKAFIDFLAGNTRRRNSSDNNIDNNSDNNSSDNTNGRDVGGSGVDAESSISSSPGTGGSTDGSTKESNHSDSTTRQELRLGRVGLYRSLTFGKGSRRVRIILLDTRSFR